MRVIIEYEGESYEFEMADITVKQGIKIERHLGCPIEEFGTRLATEDGKPPDLLALQCLGWLILHGGRGVPIEDTDFKMKALMRAVGEAMAASRAQAAESEEPGEVPTVAVPASNGQTPDPAAAPSQPFSVAASP